MTVNAGDIPTADDFNKVRAVGKSAGQIVNNSATYVNDSELLATVDASTVYTYQFMVFSTSGTVPDIKFTLTFPTGSTCSFGHIALVTTASPTGDADFGSYSSATSGSSGVSAAGTTGVQLTLLAGTLTVGSTAGTLQLQWAQNTATASDTTVHAGSNLVITQV